MIHKLASHNNKDVEEAADKWSQEAEIKCGPSVCVLWVFVCVFGSVCHCATSTNFPHRSHIIYYKNLTTILMLYLNIN
jgi:hypothetical protein